MLLDVLLFPSHVKLTIYLIILYFQYIQSKNTGNLLMGSGAQQKALGMVESVTA